MPDITKAIYLQDPDKFLTRRAWEDAVKDAKAANLAAAHAVYDAQPEGRRGLLASEQRKVDAYTAEVRALQALQDGAQVDYSKVIDTSSEVNARSAQGNVSGFGDTEYRDGTPLTTRQTMSGFVRDRGLIRDGEERLSLRAALRGIVLGDWKGADVERRAMAESAMSSGGYLLPVILSSQIIDLARNQTRVIQAGAQLFPMANRTVRVAKWLSDPSAAWHTESATIAPSDATIGMVTLTANTLAGLTLISRELLEDAENVDRELANAFARVLALKVDQAALYGGGVAPEPLGVKNTPGVITVPFGGANGGTLTNYDPILDAVGTLHDANESPTGVIYSARTGRELAKTKDTLGQSIVVPNYIADLPRYDTNQVPNTLTAGTASTASDIFTADWSQLFIGVRTELQLTVLNERYADTGQVGILAWWRGDVQVARAKAFNVTTGVL